MFDSESQPNEVFLCQLANLSLCDRGQCLRLCLVYMSYITVKEERKYDFFIMFVLQVCRQKAQVMR